MKKLLIIGGSTCFILFIVSWAFRSLMFNDEKNHSASRSHFFYSFALTESDARTPCLQAEIEGISFVAELDMGYDGVLSLPKDLLEQLTHKSDAGMVLCAGIKGKKYETPVFTIPKLHIGDLALANLSVEESTFEFERDTSLGGNIDFDPSHVSARIGWRAFLGTVILIDLSSSIAVCCDSLETLKNHGYQLEQFASTHFLSGEQFMEFEAEIDNRVVKCILDTGCTFNLIDAHSAVTSALDEEPQFANIDFAHPLPPAIFIVDGSHLGPCVFYETRLPFGAEAIVGVDFLKTQIICIDLINHQLHLSPAYQEDL